MIDLSMLFPIYKTENAAETLHSIKQSIHKVNYEIVMSGPNPPSEDVLCENVSYIKCTGSPMKSLQLASTKASGEYMSYLCDDALYCENSIDNVFSMLDAHGRSSRIAVQSKYLEAPGRVYTKRNRKNMMKERQWTLVHSVTTRSKYFPEHWKIFTHPFVKLDHFREIGGFDCTFEALAFGWMDLGVRMQRDGCEVLLTDFFVAEFDNVPGVPPDRHSGHGPMYYAQVDNDQPFYESIYSDPNCVNRIKIDFDNWKSAEEHWNRRKKS